MDNLDLTNKEIIELRIKCLAPYVAIAARANILDDVIIKKAEVAWDYAIKPLKERGETDKLETTVQQP